MQTLTRNSVLTATAALALLFAPTAAYAQFGGLIKKAQEKVAQKAEEKVGPVAPGEQLSEDLLAKVIAGAQAADRVLGDRDRVQANRDAKSKELSALIDKNGPTHQAYNEANSKIMDCRSASLSSLEEARNERYEKRMKEMQADPNMMGKMQLIAMKYGKAMQEAQQKNDAAALTKVQQDMMKEMLGSDAFADIKKDSVTTDAKCGKVPALPPALAQEEKLQKEVGKLDDEIRTLEARAVNQGAQASGMEQVRYLQLKERTLSILKRVSGENGAKYGDEELAAVKKRQADLEKLKRAL